MIRYDKGSISTIPDEFPEEFPVKLTVNGREIATLVASRHDLRFLIAGFLRTQGFVREVGDFLALGVCDDSGEAAVRIKGELPERMTPVLTSGCGTGISFTFNAGAPRSAPAGYGYTPRTIFAMMHEMAKLSDRYGRHGGIHSAAVSDGTRILFHAEDLGRHNTIDRLAGQALLNNVDLSGSLLLTSGRVSAEMAAKAASFGVAVIASRTSPTDMAVRICREAKIGLAGYVRGESLRIAANPGRFLLEQPGRIPGVTGVILAGGESRRMGTDKARLPVDGVTMIEATLRSLAHIFDNIMVVTDSPDRFSALPCRTVVDIYPKMGPLGGIHAALSQSSDERIFVVGCDMPTLNSTVIRAICTTGREEQAIVPEVPEGLEPLHAMYSRSCLPEMERMLNAHERSVLTLIDRVTSHIVTVDTIREFDPEFLSFRNINTPAQYTSLTGSE